MESAASTTTDTAGRATDAAMKGFVMAKIACTNVIDDLGIIEGITADWTEDTLINTSMDLHLHSEAASRECLAIMEELDASWNQELSEAVVKFVEMVRLAASVHPVKSIRQRANINRRNADRSWLTGEVSAVGELVRATNHAGLGDKITMATIELQKRCNRVLRRLEGLCMIIAGLKAITEHAQSLPTPPPATQG
jgi:hypothetical protein